MVWFYVISALLVVSGSFVAGAIWGRKAEQKAAAELKYLLDSVSKKL